MGDIIDYKPYMDSDAKVYVDVNEDCLKDGEIIPKSFIWEDGHEYDIARILDKRPAAAIRAGGAGMRYQVRIVTPTVTKDVYMFHEDDNGTRKWFMERREK